MLNNREIYQVYENNIFGPSATGALLNLEMVTCPRWLFNNGCAQLPLDPSESLPHH